MYPLLSWKLYMPNSVPLPAEVPGFDVAGECNCVALVAEAEFAAVLVRSMHDTPLPLPTALQLPLLVVLVHAAVANVKQISSTGIST